MKDLDKSPADKSLVERKIVSGHMPRCPPVAAAEYQNVHLSIKKPVQLCAGLSSASLLCIQYDQ